MNASLSRKIGAARQPLISVVIPAYNAAKYIGRTLGSVLAQTHAILEVIVIDDGSKDETGDIVREFQISDKRVHLVSVENGGVARARNHGISASRGEYVAFVDADDLWKPEKLERQLAELQNSGPDYAAAYTLHYVIDEEDRVVRPGNSIVATGYILARHLTFRFVGNGSTLLVRRSALQATTLFDPSYSDAGIGGCEDLDLELKLAERFKIAAVPERLVGYRIYEGNMSSNRKRMVRSLLEVNRRAVERNPCLSPRAKRKTLASQYRYALENSIRGGYLMGSIAYGLRYLANDPVGLSKFIVHKMIAVTFRCFGRPSPLASNEFIGDPFTQVDERFQIQFGENTSVWRALADEDNRRGLAMFPAAARDEYSPQKRK